MLLKKKICSLLTLAMFATASGAHAKEAQEERKPVLILLGPPGAGKGSQATMIQKKNHWTHISTGDLLREHVGKKTPLGQKAKVFMEKGELVPDEIILDMLFTRVTEKDCQKGYILDGFPRTVEQAKALDARLSSERVLVINFDVPDTVLIDRIAKRQLQERRTDDSKDVVLNRLSVYHKQTAPLIDFYKSKGRLITFDGNEEKNSLFSRVQLAIEKTLVDEKR